MILKVTSHRSRAKLTRIAPDAVNLYPSDLSDAAHYWELSDELAEQARRLPSVSKARNQNREDYSRAWSERLSGGG